MILNFIGGFSLIMSVIIIFAISISALTIGKADRHIQLWQCVGLFMIAAAICFKGV